MAEEEPYFLYDETEDTQTRYVSFVGESNRFDLAIVTTNRFYGKKLVLDIQSNRFAVIGTDDLDEPGYLEHVYKLSGEEAEELKDFLYQIVL